jgi:hypothetical protein
MFACARDENDPLHALIMLIIPLEHRRLQFKSASQPASISPPHSGTHSSSRAHASAIETSAHQGFLHLCSDEKIWAVKQVSTSNTVFVTKAYEAHTNRQDPDGDIDMHQSENNTSPNGETDICGTRPAPRGITTIAQVKNILELIPVEPSEESVEEQILSMIQTAAHADDAQNDSSEDILSKTSDKTTYSFQELVDNIPAPTTLCCRVAKSLFLIHDPSSRGSAQTRSVKPSLLLSAWKEFMQQCVILGIKIDRPERATTLSHSHDHTTTFGSVFQQMEEQHERGIDTSVGDFPGTLVRAILRRFKTRSAPVPDTDNETAADMLDDDWDSEPLTGGWDAEALTLTLGRWELQSIFHKPDIKSLRSDVFLDTHWKDLVPNAWHKFCNVSTLLEQSSGPFDGRPVETYKEAVKDEFGIVEEKEFIRVVGTGPLSQGLESGPVITANGTSTRSTASAPAVGTGKSPDDTTAAAAAKNQKKRKWHEKFGAQRNAGGGVKK